MRIAINLLYLLPGVVGGTETYAAGLLDGLATVASDLQFVIFVNREAADWPLPIARNFTRVVCPVTGSSRGERYCFEQIRLPLLLRRWRIDLVHSLGYVGPIISPCPSVLTVPDLNYRDISQTMPLKRRVPLHIVSTLAARNASAVITISDFSKTRLCQTLRVSEKKITVTHLAPPSETDATITVATSESWFELKQRYGIREPYIVAFGGGTIHKNIPALLQAFALLRAQVTHNLVLIGHLPPNLSNGTIQQRPGLQGRVIATGYVPGDHIRPLLSHAELFVMPSLYEGFGLPVLEAQQADVAVACSTAGSLPEVAGGGAIFFDPESVELMADTMIRCLSRPELRENLRQLGHENLKRFSWEQTAAKTLDVYRQVLTQSNPNLSAGG